MKNLKILIADDNESSSQLISSYVQKFGKEIIYVKTGTDAIEVCQNHPDIDLILMDIRMIEMNGLEATRKIREFNKKVIIFAQTDYVLTGAKEMAINAGYNDNISKPIKREELIALIQRYFENKIETKKSEKSKQNN